MKSLSNVAVTLQKTSSPNQSVPTSPPESIEDYVKLSDFVTKFPQFSMSQMRWLLHRRHENGLSKVCVRVGKPMYIYVPSFLQWLHERAEQQ